MDFVIYFHLPLIAVSINETTIPFVCLVFTPFFFFLVGLRFLALIGYVGVRWRRNYQIYDSRSSKNVTLSRITENCKFLIAEPDTFLLCREQFGHCGFMKFVRFKSQTHKGHCNCRN